MSSTATLLPPLLAFGAHPDDIEFGAGGIIALETAAGRSEHVFVDLVRGERTGGLDAATLAELFGWTGEDFEERMRGSAIRRIGHERWLRNIAVALGNALRADASPAIVDALRSRADHASAQVREHVAWALAQA